MIGEVLRGFDLAGVLGCAVMGGVLARSKGAAVTLLASQRGWELRGAFAWSCRRVGDRPS